MHTTKDLVNLLQLFQASRQSGDLIVEPQIQGEVPWKAQFRLVNGQMMSCQIRRKIDERVLLGDSEALRWLINPSLGKLEWSLEETTPIPDMLLPLLPIDNSTIEDGLRSSNTGNSFPTVQYNKTEQDVHRAIPRSNTPSFTSQDHLRTIPRRTEQGNHTSGSILSSRDHRQIFSLIDGRRTAEEISQLLHKAPDSVIRVLSDLQVVGLIE